MMYSRPDLMHHILEVTTQAVIDYLNAQIEAGAQAVMVFDSWGGMLSQAAYLEFSLPYMARIMAGLTRERRRRSCRASSSPRAAACGWSTSPPAAADAVGLDWTIDIGDARRRSATRWRCRATWTRASCSPPRKPWRPKPKPSWPATARASGHVFNLGHGISQFTPPDRIVAHRGAICNSAAGSRVYSL
jgi:uroporphyrinogen decarboxylase